MPQLDILTFSAQLFWFTILFIIFYFIVLKYVLPILLYIKWYRFRRIQFARMYENFVTLIPYYSNAQWLSIKKIRRALRRLEKPKCIVVNRFTNERRGVTERSVLCLKNFSRRSLNNTLLRLSPFSFLIVVNDDLILLIAFSIFVFILVVYLTMFPISNYLDKVKELSHLLTLDNVQKIKYLNTLQIKLDNNKDFRSKLFTLVVGYISYTLNLAKGYEGSNKYILNKLLPKIILERMTHQNSTKEVALSFFKSKKPLYINKDLTSICIYHGQLHCYMDKVGRYADQQKNKLNQN